MAASYDPKMYEIGTRIAQCRAEKGWNQIELSIQADLPNQTISAIESGTRVPKVDTLCKIADALQVSLADLQPKELDQYSDVPADVVSLSQRLDKMPPPQRAMFLRMFNAQIDSVL